MIARTIQKLAKMLRLGGQSLKDPSLQLDTIPVLLSQGRYQESIDRLTLHLASNPEDVEARFLRGTTMLEMDQFAQALPDLEFAAAANPAEQRYRYNIAVAHWLLGDADRALANCRVVPNIEHFLPAYQLWANIELQGEDYLAQMGRIHGYLRPRTYIEVGVATGISLRLAGPQTRAIGVDPAPDVKEPLGPSQKIFAMTSDDFFAGKDVVSELDGERVALAFIDGMHQFEFALRDFVNIERLARPESVILVHDCHPLDRATAARDRHTIFWSGDVWRLIPLLKKYRPDLSVKVIATPPTGLGIITNLDPDSRVLTENMDQIVAEFMALDYSSLEGRKAQTLNLYPNEWPRIEELLPRATRH